jgi:uncharacterized membrane protein YgcG
MQHRHLEKRTPSFLVGRSLATLGLLTLLVLAAPSATAQTTNEAERITSFDVQITVNADNTMNVTETIEYVFPEGRHGLLRDITTAAPWFDDADFYRNWPLSDVTVSSPTAPDQFTRNKVDDFTTQLRIGDPDVTISGPHTYVINYVQAGIVDAFASTDEFFWNVIGTSWQVPIENVTVEISLPGEVTQVECFTGNFGQTTACQSAAMNGNNVEVLQTNLEVFQAVTIVAAMPAGSVPNAGPILVEQATFSNVMDFTRTNLIGAGGLLAIFLVGIGVLFWRVGRDRRSSGTFTDAAFATGKTSERIPLVELKDHPVQFAPPDGVRPAHFYLLLEEDVPERIVSTTIVDLAVRGHLSIEELDDGDDYRLTKLENQDELLKFEQTLMASLFVRRESVLISDLEYVFAKRSAKVRDLIYQDAKKQNWFLGRPDRVRTAWAVGGFALFLAGIGITIFAAINIGNGVLFTPIASAGIIIAIGARWMPAKTPKGSGMAGRAVGFAYFLEQSEAYRSKLAEESHIFTEYLPYVMAIGATDKWTRAFDGINIEEPDWFVGSRGFVPYGFGHRMDSFAASAATSLSSVQPSSGSSGFSGGFSGGGGGGGGGGSW